MKIKHLVISAVAVLAVSTTAQAVTIDFEILEHEDAANADHGFTYSEDGFTLTKGVGEANFFSSWGTLATQFTGSTAMFNNQADGVMFLNQDGGGLFSVQSIDLAEVTSPTGADVEFIGTLDGGGGTVSQTFTLDGNAFGAETFIFNLDFAGLVQLEWVQQSPFHQFDNIVLNGSSIPNPVPVPAAVWLFGTALIGLVGFGKRKIASDV